MSRIVRLLLFATLLLAPLAATATSVKKLDLPQLVELSKTIVVGEVAETRAYEDEGRVFTETTIEVDESLKGEENGEVVIRQIGGRTENLATRVPGMPGFEEGEEVVVFLEMPRHSDVEHYVVAGLAQGKFHVAIGPDNSTRYVVPQLGNLALVEKVQATTSGKTVERIQSTNPAALHLQIQPLEDFKDEIRSIVEEQSR